MRSPRAACCMRSRPSLAARSTIATSISSSNRSETRPARSSACSSRAPTSPTARGSNAICNRSTPTSNSASAIARRSWSRRRRRCAGAEDGSGRAAHRRHRARFQQSAAGHHRQPGDRPAPRRAGSVRRARSLHRRGATTSAKRAAALTHRLLAFSRRQPLDPRPVNVNPLVASASKTCSAARSASRSSSRWCWRGGLWTTLVDPNQLENALLNLVHQRARCDAGWRQADDRDLQRALDDPCAQHARCAARPVRLSA